MIPQTHIPALANFSGSFWRTHLHADSKPLFWRMRELLAESSVLTSLRDVVAGLYGGDPILGPKWVPYLPDACLILGSAPERWMRTTVGNDWLVTRPSSDTEITSDILLQQMVPGAYVVIPGVIGEPVGDALRSWLVPIPADLVPSVIAGKTWMVAGIDFHAYPGFIEVFRSPDELFAPEGFVLMRYTRPKRNATSYTFHSDGAVSALSARYFQDDQMAGSLIAAACQSAGLVAATEQCGILAVTAAGYITDCGPLPIPYEHTPLEVGTTLQAGQFVGAAPEVVDLSSEDFPFGFPLNLVSPWELTIPPGVIRVDVVSGHVQPYLVGTQSERERYWFALAAADAADPEHTVAGVLGLTAGTHSVRWLDLVADQVLGRHMWIVRLNAAGTSPAIRASISEFLRKEKPLGKILVPVDPADLPVDLD